MFCSLRQWGSSVSQLAELSSLWENTEEKPVHFPKKYAFNYSFYPFSGNSSTVYPRISTKKNTFN